MDAILLKIDSISNYMYLPFIKCDRLGGHRTR
jgi:hypothetical protein